MAYPLTIEVRLFHHEVECIVEPTVLSCFASRLVRSDWFDVVDWLFSKGRVSFNGRLDSGSIPSGRLGALADRITGWLESNHCSSSHSKGL